MSLSTATTSAASNPGSVLGLTFSVKEKQRKRGTVTVPVARSLALLQPFARYWADMPASLYDRSTCIFVDHKLHHIEQPGTGDTIEVNDALRRRMLGSKNLWPTVAELLQEWQQLGRVYDTAIFQHYRIGDKVYVTKSPPQEGAPTRAVQCIVLGISIAQGSPRIRCVPTRESASSTLHSMEITPANIVGGWEKTGPNLEFHTVASIRAKDTREKQMRRVHENLMDLTSMDFNLDLERGRAEAEKRRYELVAAQAQKDLVEAQRKGDKKRAEVGEKVVQAAKDAVQAHQAIVETVDRTKKKVEKRQQLVREEAAKREHRSSMPEPEITVRDARDFKKLSERLGVGKKVYVRFNFVYFKNDVAARLYTDKIMTKPLPWQSLASHLTYLYRLPRDPKVVTLAGLLNQYHKVTCVGFYVEDKQRCAILCHFTGEIVTRR